MLRTAQPVEITKPEVQHFEKAMKTYLEPEDVRLLEEAATCFRDRLLIRLLFRTGCRISEVLALKVEDMDFIKISTEYPSACWRDESGSPKGKAKEFALNG